MLNSAARGNAYDVIKMLSKGIDVDVRLPDGRTSLFIVSQNGHIEVVRALLADGAYTQMARFDGATSLHAASHQGHINVVRALLEAGADANKAANNGATPLLTASHQGHVDVIKALLAKGAFKSKNKARYDGVTPLLTASHKGHINVVRVLLEAGADTNKAENNGATPLLVASMYGRIEVVRDLLAAGADTNKAANNGATPLLIASKIGHIEIVRDLLAAGADTNKAANNGATSLLLASHEGHIDVVRSLVVAGSDTKVTVNGKTAEIAAKDAGHGETVKLAIEESLKKRADNANAELLPFLVDGLHKGAPQLETGQSEITNIIFGYANFSSEEIAVSPNVHCNLLEQHHLHLNISRRASGSEEDQDNNDELPPHEASAKEPIDTIKFSKILDVIKFGLSGAFLGSIIAKPVNFAKIGFGTISIGKAATFGAIASVSLQIANSVKLRMRNHAVDTYEHKTETDMKKLSDGAKYAFELNKEAANGWTPWAKACLSPTTALHPHASIAGYGVGLKEKEASKKMAAAFKK